MTASDRETTQMIARWLFDRFGVGLDFEELPDDLRAEWLKYAGEIIALRSL